MCPQNSDIDPIPRAIVRNLFELAYAIYERKVLVAMEEFDDGQGVTISGLNFILICHKALFNDMLGHCMKVLDLHPRSASFWMILRMDAERVSQMASYSENTIKFLRDIAERIKPVRDKTHFHIDRKAVFDPKALWTEAGITGIEYKKTLDHLWAMLTELHKVVHDREFIERAPEYEAREVRAFLEWARSVELVV